MTRNENKQKKFNLTFGPNWMTVTEFGNEGVRCNDYKGLKQRRHLDDVKIAACKETKGQEVENQENKQKDE